MSRYYFHLCDGSETLIDPDGREVPDESLLGELAVKDARAIISHDALAGYIRLNQSIEVRDDQQKLILRLPFRDAVSLSD